MKDLNEQDISKLAEYLNFLISSQNSKAGTAGVISSETHKRVYFEWYKEFYSAGRQST